MTRVRIAVDVDASPEQAWRVVSDPRNLPHWDRHIVGVEGAGRGLTEGARYTTVMRFMAVRTRIRCEVQEWDPPHLACIALSGLVDATVRTTISPLGSGERCRLEHEVDYRFRGGPLGELGARSIRAVGGATLALKHGALAQKREIESA